MTDRARGQDVAGDNQPIAKMRYGEWGALGFCFGFAQVRRGRVLIRDSHPHRAAMRAAAYLTGPYAALYDDPIETMKVLIGERDADDRLPNMLDAEFGGLTEPVLRAAVDYHLEHTPVELLMYTGTPWWTQHVPAAARAHYADLGLIIAAYPYDSPPTRGADGMLHDIQPMDPEAVARRSTPPAGGHLAIPEPWTNLPRPYWSWQHTGHGSLPGHTGFLDLHVSAFTEAELRARYTGGVVTPPAPAGPKWTAAELATIAGVARAVRAAADTLSPLG